MIPYGRQDISDDDVRAVVDVLRSDFLTQGPAVPAFEQAVARHCRAAHAIAVNSATSALHLACLAVGVGPGDLVWTSPITFVASANCARYCGADVDFVDVEIETGNMCTAALAAKLEEAAAAGRLPKAVIPVHLSGTSCDMAEIGRLAAEFGFAVIEDASHAIGARYRDRPVGCCDHSHVAVFSFHPVKIITTGEGGLATTNDPDLARRMELLRSHGITRDPERMTREPDGPWYYQQVELGFNYRMTDIQAALGDSQMRRLDAFVARRHEIALWYDAHLGELPIDLPHRPDDVYSALHLYVVRLRLEQLRRSHREIFEALRADGIGVNLHYIPVHLQPYYAALGFAPGHCPVAEDYYARAITIPLHPQLGDGDLEAVRRALERACA